MNERTAGSAAGIDLDKRTTELIAAADERASAYDGDDREGIKNDVINAFYGGAEWERRRATLQHPGLDNLCSNIDALLALDQAGSLVPHGIGGHARSLLTSALAALRATPQHSVTEQDERADFEEEVRELDAPGNVLNQWPDGRYIDETIECYWAGWQWRARRAQPLPSTAATQPQQADDRLKTIKRWKDRIQGPDMHGQPYDRDIDAADDEIADLRAALAIPASTAPDVHVRGDTGDGVLIIPASTAATCWSCKRTYTADQRADADGNCPHCGVEIEQEASTAASERKPPSKEWYLHMAALESEAGVNIEAGAAGEQQAGADERALFEAWLATGSAEEWSTFNTWRGGYRAALTHRATTIAPMTYDEFFAEARRLGCKLSDEDCAQLAAAPDIATTAADRQGAVQAQAGEKCCLFIGGSENGCHLHTDTSQAQRILHDDDLGRQTYQRMTVSVEDSARTIYVIDYLSAAETVELLTAYYNEDHKGREPIQQADNARDAARYRWLRNSASWGIAVYEAVGHGTREDIDAAIDAAMAAPSTTGGGNG